MLYDKLQGLPSPGSLQETICSMIFDNRQERATIEQLSRMSSHVFGGKDRVRWMQHYLMLVYPYLDEEEAAAVQRSPLEVLQQAAQKGPFRIKAAADPVGDRKRDTWRNAIDARTRR